METTDTVPYDTFTAFIEAAQQPATPGGRGFPFVDYTDSTLFFNREGVRHEYEVGAGNGMMALTEFNRRIGNRKFFNDDL
jgi:hypothetical protein